MAFAEIMDWVSVILLLVFIITQCFIPEMTGKPWFPLFRRRYRLEAEHSKLEEKIEDEKYYHEQIEPLKEKQNASSSTAGGHANTKCQEDIPSGDIGSSGDCSSVHSTEQH